MNNVWTSLARAFSTLPHRKVAGASGLLIGAAVGTTLALAVAVAAANRTAVTSEPVLDATHLPALLTRSGEPVELRYDVYCAAADGEAGDTSCDATGSVFVRPGEAGPFRELLVHVDPDAIEGRHSAFVPSDIAGSRKGFTYYAIFRSEAAGMTLTLPAGGPEAPQRSLPLDRAVEVRLGTHVFGASRRADARAAQAAWGDGPGEIGLEPGRNPTPIGGSSFDVDAGGTVHVLDQVHKRLLRWSAGVDTPSALPLSIDGTLADLSVAADGTIYVLETAVAGRKPRLRIFGRDGSANGVAEIAERTASQVRVGPNTAVVLQHPSGQWMPAVADGKPLAASAQKASGRSGREVPGGAEVVLLRTGNEIRAAIADGNGVRRAWRVTSETPVGEIQLAEPLGNRLVLVARMFTDDRDEFVGLVLGPTGLLRSFALSSADWAETAPLTRFRLAGASLYQLGSTPAGLFVDRFDLEVT